MTGRPVVHAHLTTSLNILRKQKRQNKQIYETKLWNVIKYLNEALKCVVNVHDCHGIITSMHVDDDVFFRFSCWLMFVF